MLLQSEALATTCLCKTKAFIEEPTDKALTITAIAIPAHNGRAQQQPQGTSTALHNNNVILGVTSRGLCSCCMQHTVHSELDCQFACSWQVLGCPH
jgi:hypothetical protein